MDVRETSFMPRPFYPTESNAVSNNARLSGRQREYRRCQMRNDFMTGGKICIMDLWVTQLCTEVGCTALFNDDAVSSEIT